MAFDCVFPRAVRDAIASDSAQCSRPFGYGQGQKVRLHILAKSDFIGHQAESTKRAHLLQQREPSQTQSQPKQEYFPSLLPCHYAT